MSADASDSLSHFAALAGALADARHDAIPVLLSRLYAEVFQVDLAPGACVDAVPRGISACRLTPREAKQLLDRGIAGVCWDACENGDSVSKAMALAIYTVVSEMAPQDTTQAEAPEERSGLERADAICAKGSLSTAYDTSVAYWALRLARIRARVSQRDANFIVFARARGQAPTDASWLSNADLYAMLLKDDAPELVEEVARFLLWPDIDSPAFARARYCGLVASTTLSIFLRTPAIHPDAACNNWDLAVAVLLDVVACNPAITTDVVIRLLSVAEFAPGILGRRTRSTWTPRHAAEITKFIVSESRGRAALGYCRGRTRRAIELALSPRVPLDANIIHSLIRYTGSFPDVRRRDANGRTTRKDWLLFSAAIIQHLHGADAQWPSQFIHLGDLATGLAAEKHWLSATRVAGAMATPAGVATLLGSDLLHLAVRHVDSRYPSNWRAALYGIMSMAQGTPIWPGLIPSPDPPVGSACPGFVRGCMDRCSYESGKYADLVILVDEVRRVPVSRVLLATASPFWHMILGRGKTTGDTLEWNDDFIKGDCLAEYLRYIHTGECTIEHDNALCLLSTAHMTEIQGLVAACLRYLRTHYDEYDWLDLVWIARTYDCPELQALALHAHIRAMPNTDVDDLCMSLKDTSRAGTFPSLGVTTSSGC